MTSTAQTFVFPIVAWDDVEGRDVWVGDVAGSINDPLAARFENVDGVLVAIANSLGVEVDALYVVRSVEG